jgi:hypothetical protein
MAGDGGLPLGRERGFELIRDRAKAPDHLRCVGAAPYRRNLRAAGRIESAARDGEEGR